LILAILISLLSKIVCEIACWQEHSSPLQVVIAVHRVTFGVDRFIIVVLYDDTPMPICLRIRST